ncbi:MAG: TetR/AcrR family transcriptional regulator [Clostridiales bacterium]|nr:TetR/AcrR family transcriptional regulator [Clostridiales bacterium]
MRKQPEVTERTKQKFVDAFWTLAEDKPISKIAVSELTRIAGYNRSTFYEYFLDTDDLLEYIENKMLDEIKRAIDGIPAENKSADNLFKTIFTLMNEKIYLLSGPNGDSGFLSRVRAELVPFMTDCFFPVPENIPYFDYLLSYFNAAMFGLLRHWHDKEKNINAEEFSTMLHNLIFSGIGAYLPKENEEKIITG